MATYLNKEDGNFLLQESGFKIVLQLGSSPSASVSPSASSSPSVSPSASLSPSASVSSSPSISYADYSKQASSNLPSNNVDLSSLYTQQEVEATKEEGLELVIQDGGQMYIIHQFKNFIGANTIATIEWTGQSTLAPDNSPVYLQIFNQITQLWEQIDIVNDASENQTFVLNKTIRDTTNYKDSSQVISCRVYQFAI